MGGGRLLEEGESFAGQRITRRRDRAPGRNGAGDLLDLGCKRLDHDETVVAGLLERSEDVVPRHMPGARRPAVVLAGVEMTQARTRGDDRIRDALLLDVHVEGVQEQPDVVETDPLAEIEALLHR